MGTERFGMIKFKGLGFNVPESDLKAGQIAPKFSTQTKDWVPFNGLDDMKVKIRIIAPPPSLDIEVCDHEMQGFNHEAAPLSKDISDLVIGADLLFPQKHW